MLSNLYYSVAGNNVPEGVLELKKLGGGYGVGYDSSERRVVLYSSKGIVAHVKIAEHPSSDSISLHTGTDSGDVGAQGYMAAMFPEALKIVRREFSTYSKIEMAPAPGAATKGLISQLSRLRSRMPLSNPTRFAGVRKSLAAQYLVTADELRRARKTRPQPSAKLDAQAWSDEAMVETAHELNALTELESASPTGLEIRGLTPGFNEKLVGSGASLLWGGALAWYRSGTEHSQGMLQITIPMAAVGQYIAALS